MSFYRGLARYLFYDNLWLYTINYNKLAIMFGGLFVSGSGSCYMVTIVIRSGLSPNSVWALAVHGWAVLAGVFHSGGDAVHRETECAFFFGRAVVVRQQFDLEEVEWVDVGVAPL